MPLGHEVSLECSTGGTPLNRRFFRRLNPMVYLSICCTLFIFVIVAALITFTFLPIFSATDETQTKYQIQSDVLLLMYNLPDRLSISPMNWSYVVDELDFDKLNILQNLLQEQLNEKKFTRKTSVSVTDAYIVRQVSPSKNLLVASPITLDHNNKTIITIMQPGIGTHINSTNQLMITLKLRYALECAKKCQNNMKETVFARTFHSLDVPLDTFQLLFTERIYILPDQILSSMDLTTTTMSKRSCLINTNAPVQNRSLITATNYEAESLTNTFISSSIQTCSVCSGERKVTNIGFANELIIEQISSTNGGLTTIIFYYLTDRQRYAQLSLNNELTSTNITFPAMLPNQPIASVSILLTLCQGFNSLRIYNRNDYTAAIDRIIVY